MNISQNRLYKLVFNKLSLGIIASILIISSPLILAMKDKHDHGGHKETAHDEANHNAMEEHADAVKAQEKEHDHEDDKNMEEDKADEKGHVESGDGDGHDHDAEKAAKGDDDGHGHGTEEAGHGEEAVADVELTKAQIQQAGIELLTIKKQSTNNQIAALSEVKLNQYKTIKASPTITTRVEKRHVRLGDRVNKGQKLVTLHTIATTDISANMLATADLATSSAEFAANIAEAKGELAATTATWNRIRSLGREAVSGKRYIEAKLAKEQAEAKLKAYGKSQSKIDRLLKSGSKGVQKHFELVAEQAGTVIKDDFVLGQVVTPEDVLIEISDLDHLWVEANIKPKDVTKISTDSQAVITTNGKTLQGKVIHIGRVIDEKTRTLPVRIEVKSTGVNLYPGQFVKTLISSTTTRSAITVPAEAVLRSSDGDWVLFVQQAPGRFVPKEVEIVENLSDRLIIAGIEPGTTIVSKGAFTVQSELAKSGFSVHNH